MSSSSTQATEVQILRNVPNDKVAEKVRQMQNNDRYVSHEVFPENGTTSRIEVTVKKID